MEIILDNVKYQIDEKRHEAYVMPHDYKGDVIIPTYIQYDGELWVAVKGITRSAFRECEELTSVSLPDGLCSIESYAFCGCTKLKEISIPDTVRCIEHDAFSNCSSLERVKLPPLLECIDYSLFYECESLQEIDIPPHVTSLASRCFYMCKQLKRVSLPEGLREIGRNCFARCESLTEISLPDSAVHLADNIFTFCEKLQRVKLPPTLNYIPESCFLGCVELSDIDIPSSVEWIGENAFHWTGIQEKQADELQYVGTVLNGGLLPEKEEHVLRVKEGTRCISNRAFYENEELTEVIIPASVETIGEDAFAYCKNLKRVQLAEGLKTIGMGAFSHCGALEAIYIPSSVKSICSGAFSYCTSMKQMVVDAKNKRYNSRKNCNGIVHTELKMLVAACPSTVILDVLEAIGDNAFQGVYPSHELIVPQNVKCIGRNAFCDNSSLQRVVIHDEVEVIGSYAFLDCSALNEIVLPKNYVEIGEDAFFGTACVNNQSPGAAYVGNHMCCYTPHTFNGPEPDCMIPEGIEYIDMCVFDFDLPMRIFFPKSMKKVDVSAFFPNESGYELIAPEGVGDDYPVKNGRIKYQFEIPNDWWDVLNEGLMDEETWDEDM